MKHFVHTCNDRAGRVGIAVVIVLVALVCAALVILRSHVRQQPVFGAEYLPSDTIAMTSITNIQQYSRDLRRTSAYQLWSEGQVRKFLDTWIISLKVRGTDIEEASGADLQKAKTIFHGGAVLAFVPSAHDKTKGAVVGLAEYNQSRQAVEEFLAGMRTRSEMSGSAVWEEQKYRNVSIVSAKRNDGVSSHYAILKSSVAFGSERQSLEKLIDAMLYGARKPLSESPTFKLVSSKVRRRGQDIIAYVNLEKWLAISDKRVPDRFSTGLAVLGVRSVRAVGASATFEGKGIRDVVYLDVPGQTEGIVKIISWQPTSRKSSAKLAPENATAYSVGNPNFSELRGQMSELLAAIDPETAGSMDNALSEFEKRAGFSLHEDLFGALSGELAYYSVLPKGELLVPEMVLMFGVKNREKAEGALRSLVVQAFANGNGLKEAPEAREGATKVSQFLEETDYEGCRIVTARALYGPRDREVLLHWSFVQEHLIISIDASAIHDTIDRVRKGTRSLSDNRDFERALAKVPRTNFALSYFDLRRAFEQMYSVTGPVLRVTGADQSLPVDLADLPDTEVVSQHLFALVSVTTKDADGIMNESYSPFGSTFSLGTAGMAAGIFFSTVTENGSEE